MFENAARLRLGEKEKEQPDYPTYDIALKELRRARRKDSDAMRFKVGGKTHDIVVLDGMEEKRDLVEVGDDIPL